jgi:hypothetical protein
MQKVAGYLLERRDGLENADARAVAHKQYCDVVREWLRIKGADLRDVHAGSYRA